MKATKQSPPTKQEEDIIVRVEAFVRGKGGRCYRSDIGTHFKNTDLTPFASLTALLNEGKKQNRFTLTTEGSTAYVSVPAAKSKESKKKEKAKAVGEVSSTCVYVTNLPFEMDHDGLFDVFGRFEPVRAKVALRKNGKSKGFGFVEFRTPEHVLVVLRQIFHVGDRELIVQQSASQFDESVGGDSAATEEYVLLKSVADARSVCDALLAASFITVDCEGVSLGLGGQDSLTLVQVAGVVKGKMQAYLFDVKSFPALIDPLKVLFSGSVVKVMHDCRKDIVALLQRGVSCAPVLDSQVVYAVKSGRAREISLSDFLKEFIGSGHPLKQSAPHISDPQFWAKRPISPLGLNYAALDVKLLYEAAMSPAFKATLRNDFEGIRLATDARIADELRPVDGNDDDGGRDEFDDASVFRNYANCTQVRMQHVSLQVDSEFDLFLEALPPHVRELIQERVPNAAQVLMDVVMDLQTPICFVLSGSNPPLFVRKCLVTQEDLDFVIDQCGDITDANRACVGRSLHRMSVKRDHPRERIVGLTLRCARCVKGLAGVIADCFENGESVLLVGAPGQGKTTLLRDMAYHLANVKQRRVHIVDTNNEIAGEQDVAHRAVGDARRMKVGPRREQHQRMLECVQNHTPETLIIDEIGTRQEVFEAVGVKQRGVQLIATTHGRTLADVILNPHLRDLLGGVNTVILSAQERAEDGCSSKTRNERRMEPAFDVCVELTRTNEWRVHRNIGKAVDVVLRQMGEYSKVQVRKVTGNGAVEVSVEAFPQAQERNMFTHLPTAMDE